MPETITLNIGGFIAICTAFTAVCVAMGWLWKITKPMRKPIEDVKEGLGKIDERSKACADMFANDKRRLDRHEQLLAEQGKRLDALCEDIKQLLQNDLMTLEHIETGNNTGEVAKRRKALEEYIVKSR